MTRQHYHVGNGNPGCLFDSISGPYTSRREAASEASRESRDYKALHDEGTQPESRARRFVLKDARGHPSVYVVERPPYNSQYFWEVFPCNEPLSDCENAAEW